MERDSVCGMDVDSDKSNWVVQHNGEDYYFCSESCQNAFIKDPVKYTEMKRIGRDQSGHRRHGSGCCGSGGGSW